MQRPVARIPYLEAGVFGADCSGLARDQHIGVFRPNAVQTEFERGGAAVERKDMQYPGLHRSRPLRQFDQPTLARAPGAIKNSCGASESKHRMRGTRVIDNQVVGSEQASADTLIRAL